MKRNYFLIVAGLLNFFTAILHTFSGHADHMSPVLESAFSLVDKTVLLGVWHMVSIVFFMTCYPAFKKGLNNTDHKYDLLIRYFGYIYIFWAVLFIFCSIYMNFHALQWVLLLPIGILYVVGSKR